MKEKMNKIPVFYACDDNFVKYTMVSLQSMMDHASKEVQYEIHVLHTNISEEMQKKMYAMENANFSVQFDHVTESGLMKIVRPVIRILSRFRDCTQRVQMHVICMMTVICFFYREIPWDLR